MALPTITVCGNVKRMETTQVNGKNMTKFQVECGEKKKDDTWNNLYLSCAVWEKTSDFFAQYFKEGSPIIVTGKLHTNVYEKQDGTKVYENKLLFTDVSFAPKEKEVQQSQQQGHNPQPQQQPEIVHQSIDDPENEIPF